MSYRHPRFYKEDYTGFNQALQQSFQKSFSDAKSYFDEQIEQRKEYEADLYTQAEKMREEAKAAGNVGADFQKELEENIQNFLKEGLRMEATGKKGGIGLFGQNITEYKKDKLDLDKANANFNAEIAAANGITNRTFVAGLEIDEDYDHGSGSYLEYASVVKALKGNFKEGGNMNFKYKGEGSNEFGFGITINNPRWREGDPEEEKMITYSAQDIQRLIAENDPAAREQIEKDVTSTVNSLIGTYESRQSEAVANARKRGVEVVVRGEDSVQGVVKQFMQQSRQQDENNPDDGSIVDDIFNNKVNFNDKIRLEELEKVDGGEDLIGFANNEDKTQKLAQLLDTPHTDFDYQKKILKELGVEDIDGALKTLEAAKNNMVERYLVNEVVASGVTSQYIQAKEQPTPSQPTSGSGGSKVTPIDTYADKKFEEITSFLGGASPIVDESSFTGPPGSPRVVSVGNFNEQFRTTYDKSLDNIFLNQKISTDVGDKDIKEVLYNPDTKEIAFSYIANKNMKLKTNKDGVQEFGDLGDQTEIFDLSDPISFEKLYQKIGTRADGESKESRQYEVKYKQLAKDYGLLNFLNHLADDGSTGLVDASGRDIGSTEADVSTFGDTTIQGIPGESKIRKGDMSKWVTYTLQNNPAEVYDYFKDGTIINVKEPEYNNDGTLKTPARSIDFGNKIIKAPSGQTMTFNDYMVILEARKRQGQF